MKNLLIVVLLLLTPALADELTSSHSVDIDRDGVEETVGLRPYQRDGVTYGQLVLKDADGRTLWEGSKQAREFVFLGEFDAGTLEAVYWSEGSLYLLGSYQKSDVRPTRYRLFTWHDAGFVHLRDGDLLPDPQNPTAFTWQKDPGASRWIDRVDGTDEKGRLKATITDLRQQTQNARLLRPSGHKYVVSD